MKLSQIVFLCALGAGMALPAAEKGSLPPPPEIRGWRTASAKGEEQTFAPVPEADSIRFGNKTVKLLPDGRIQCVTPEHGMLFSVSMPFFTVEKNGLHHDWNITHFDREKSKLTRDGNKYTWELWYKRGNVKPFQGIAQTLEILPDGRLLLTSRYQLPTDTPECKLRPWTLGFQLNDGLWLNEKALLDGKTVTLDDNFKSYRTAWNLKQMDWIVGQENPAKKFGIQVDLSKGGDMSYAQINRFKWGKKGFQILFYATRKDLPFKVYFDFRKGLAPSRAGETRGGVNFKTIENMILPDIHNKNMVTNPSLECNLEGWHSPFSTRRERWYEPIKLDSSTAYDGQYSLQFTTDTTHWPTISPILGPIRVVAEPGYYTFSFYAKGEPDAKNTEVSCWISDFHTANRAGWPLQNKCWWKFKVTPEWKRYQGTFFVPPKSPVVHLEFFGYNPKHERKFWIDAVQLEKGKTATAYQPHPVEGGLFTASPDNFIQAGKPIDGKLVITSAKPGDEGEVKVTVKNFFGEKVLELNRKFKTDSKRKTVIPLPLEDIPGLGVFVVRADYKLKNGESYYDLRRYARIEFQDMPRPNKRIFAFDYSPSEMKYNYRKVLDRYQKLGVGAKHWHHTTSRKIWDLEASYGIMPLMNSFLSYKYRDKARKIDKTEFYIHDGIRKGGDGGIPKTEPKNVLIRDFHVEAGGKITPEYQEKLKQVVKSLVARSPHILHWALCGEITCKLHNEWWGKDFTDQDVARYIALLLQAFAAGVREGNPKAKIISEVPANMDRRGGIAEADRVLGECNKLGVKFDIIGIHTYRYKPEDPDLDEDARILFEVMKKNGYDQTPVIWPEGMHWGPFDIPQWGTRSVSWQSTPRTWHGLISYDMGWTEKKSAAWYARSWLVALKYADRIIGSTAGNTGNNCFMDLQLTPYAAQLVSNTLCCILGDAKFKKDIRFAPYIRTYVFEDAQKRPVAVVWNHHENVDNGRMDAPMVTVKFGSCLESVRDLMNSERSFTPGTMRFAVTPFPLFFRGKPGTLKEMISALENAEPDSGATFNPMTVSAVPASAEKLRMTVQNSLSKEFNGTLDGQALRVAPSGQAALEVPLKKNLKFNAIVTEKRTATLRTDSGRVYNCDIAFDAFAVKRVADSATLGTLNWDQLPAIPMKAGKGCTMSGEFRMGWNPANLFLEARIRDPKYVHVEFPNPADRWNNDCLQVYFDTFANARDRLNKGYDVDDYDYAVFPNSKGTAAQVFRYRTVESQLGLATQAPPDMTFAPDIPCSFSNRDGILTYRIVFPAKYLLPMRLKKGWAFGFGLFAPDAVAQKKLKGFLTIASDNGGCHNRPHVWPAAVLTE